MQPMQILLTLDSRGAVITANGDKLRVVPSSALDDALRAAIRANRESLLKVLCAPSSHKPMTAPEKVKADEQSTLGGEENSPPSEYSEPETAFQGGSISALKPNRLRGADVKKSTFDVPAHHPTDPTKVLLAEECASILATFGNAAAMTRRGDWLIHGTRYSHDQAHGLAARVVARRNGEPVEVTPAKYFDAGAAYRANGLLSGDAVIEIQGDELPVILREVSEVKS
jgi:hypothetical protein